MICVQELTDVVERRDAVGGESLVEEEFDRNFAHPTTRQGARLDALFGRSKLR